MKKVQVTQLPEGKWVRENLEQLVETCAGQFVVVAGSEGFVSSNLKDALLKAKKKHPKVRPLIMEIPNEKDFLHVLIFLSLHHSSAYAENHGFYPWMNADALSASADEIRRNRKKPRALPVEIS